MVTIVDIPGDKIEVVNGSRVIRMPAAHRIYAEHDLVRYGLFDTFADSVYLTPEGDRMVLDCSEPCVQRYKDGLHFEVSGLPEESAAIDDYYRHFTPREDSLVFDLGAYCGVSTYHFAKRVGKVIAVEPDPVNFHCLYRNLVRHHLENVICMCAAVSDTDGWELFNAEGALGSSLEHIQPNRLLRGRTSVATVSLQSLVEKYGEPDLVKMDIEGSELDVLGACRDLIAKLTKTEFVVDTCHSVGGRPTADRIEQIFRECGYVSKSSDHGVLCTWAWRD